VVAAVVTTSASIVSLVDPEALGARGAVVLAIAGVLTLVASLLVTSADYSARSERFFRAYRSLQALSTKVEFEASHLEGDEKAVRARELDFEYQAILDTTGNHSPADHFKANPPVLAGSRGAGTSDDAVGPVRFAAVWVQRAFSSLATILPLALAVASVALATPMIRWLFDAG
jgi:hypothetical protein